MSPSNSNMMQPSRPGVFIAGAGGEIPSLFSVKHDAPAEFEPLIYPGWRQYASKDFTIEALIADLETQITTKVPDGPVRIVGYSIGGHFGYAIALKLLASGRQVSGFCAIDSFMIESLAPTAGWKRRALSDCFEILRAGDRRELSHFIRSKFWRALLRVAPARIPGWLSRYGASLVTFDKVLEAELNLHLLVRKAAPWMQSLDRDPVALEVPAILLRTPQNSRYDEAWRRRCPNLEIVEISGQHNALFNTDNIASMREALGAATTKW